MKKVKKLAKNKNGKTREWKPKGQWSGKEVGLAALSWMVLELDGSFKRDGR
jgi:hypothetical protein